MKQDYWIHAAVFAMFYNGILPLITGNEFNHHIQHSSYYSKQHIVWNVNSPEPGPDITTTRVSKLNNWMLWHHRRICCRASSFPYHGYAMRKILPLCIKTVTCKSKGFLCLFGHNSRLHCFWLKNLNLFSQNITFRVINYLNLVEKIIRNCNVDEVPVPIISKDSR